MNHARRKSRAGVLLFQPKVIHQKQPMARIINFSRAARKLREADEKAGAYIARRALEMLKNGVKPKQDSK